ncbi:MAG: hypothetical protein J7539_04040 [Niabella sp.]|nr:hypothetical protein [Niabella sp.]
MKLQSIAFGTIVLATLLASCKGGSNADTAATGSFCKDSACMVEPLRFGSPTPDKPFVTVSFKDCKIDTIHWEKGKKEGVTDIIFKDFIPNDVRPSKSIFTCDVVADKCAWLRFNDCPTGRGYLIKLPFDKKETTVKYTSAINNFDPKFKVADGLVAYYDNTFIYVEDINTGKTAQTLLTDTGITGIDYNDVHSVIDSVNITKSNIYAKILFKGKDIVHNEPLAFK